MKVQRERVARQFPRKSKLGNEFLRTREGWLWTVRCCCGEVAADTTGLGWQGLAYYRTKRDAARAVRAWVESGNHGCAVG